MFFKTVFLVLIILFSLNPLSIHSQVVVAPPEKKLSWEQVVRHETDVYYFFKEKQKEIEQTPYTLGKIETLYGSMSHASIQEDTLSPHLFSYQFDVVAKKKGDTVYTGIGGLKINERLLSDPQYSRFANLHYYSALLTNAHLTLPESSYNGYLTSVPDMVTNYISLGTWAFVPAKTNQETVPFEWGLFAVGNYSSSKEIVDELKKDSLIYQGSALVTRATKVSSSEEKIDLRSNQDVIEISIDWGSQIFTLTSYADNSPPINVQVPFTINENLIVQAQTQLPEGEKIDIRGQFYGPDGSEFGGALTIENELENIQMSFALLRH